MKRDYFTFFIVFFSLGVLSLNAQHTCSEIPRFSSQSNAITNYQSLGIIGSTYVKKGTFTSANVNSANSNYATTSVYSVRYNAFRDIMEYQDENNDILILDTNKDFVIEFNDTSKKVYHTVNHSNKRGYSILLWESADKKMALYMKEKIKFQRKRDAVTSYDISVPARFKAPKMTYYIKTNDSEMVQEVPFYKKSFFKMFKDKQEQVASFVKKEKLKIHKEKDLVKIMDFYDSI